MNFDADERRHILAIMFGAYGQASDAERLAIYAATLKGIPNELLGKAVKKLLLESKFMPSIAEIKTAAESLYQTVDDSGRIRDWAEAWAEIEKAMQATPWGKTPTFSRTEVQEAVACIGWSNLQRCAARDFNTLRAQVRQAYELICKRKRDESCNGYILGVKPDGLFRPSGGMQPIGSVIAQIGAKAAGGR